MVRKLLVWRAGKDDGSYSLIYVAATNTPTKSNPEEERGKGIFGFPSYGPLLQESQGSRETETSSNIHSQEQREKEYAHVPIA